MSLATKRLVRLLIVLARLALGVRACSIGSGTGSDTVPSPGTKLWDYQGTSNVFTAAWSPDGTWLSGFSILALPTSG